MNKFKVAVIGCGTISVMHLDSIVNIGLCELVAVCDIKEDRAKKAAEKYNTKYYTDYKKMIEREKLDAVHICLPHYIHTSVSQYALSNGINVLSEKPMSIDYKSAEDTVLLAEEKGLNYGIIFQCRYNTPACLVKKRITDGKLGKVKCANLLLTWDRSDNYYSNSDWKGTWEKEGGGVIIDQAIHTVDLVNWFIDSKPVSVQSSLHNRNHEIMEVEDTAEGLILYENGTRFSFYTMNHYLSNDPIQIKLICENGTAVLSYGEATITYNNGEVEQVENQPQKMVSYTGGKDYWGTQHAVQILQFYKSLLGEEELEMSGREALKTHKIICDIYNNDDQKLRK